MKKLFIIGNWKSYKTVKETTVWFQELRNKNRELMIKNKEIILCVPFIFLSLAKDLIEKYDLPIKLGSQNISPFGEGKYTGEVNGKQIKEFADYVIIGHSERRNYFSENEVMISQKIEQAISSQLIPILCVSEVKQLQNIKNNMQDIIIAYEPLFAIGSGTPDSPKNAEKISGEIQKKMHNSIVIYGGSVTAQNVNGFTSTPSISGVLPGGASLNAQEFVNIIIHA